MTTFFMACTPYPRHPHASEERLIDNGAAGVPYSRLRLLHQLTWRSRWGAVLSVIALYGSGQVQQLGWPNQFTSVESSCVPLDFPVFRSSILGQLERLWLEL